MIPWDYYNIQAANNNANNFVSCGTSPSNITDGSLAVSPCYLQHTDMIFLSVTG